MGEVARRRRVGGIEGVGPRCRIDPLALEHRAVVGDVAVETRVAVLVGVGVVVGLGHILLGDQTAVERLVVLFEGVDRVAVAVGADHLVFVDMLLHGNFARLSLRRGGIHVVVITDGLGLKEEPDPFAFLGVERAGGSAEQLPQTGVDLAVAFVYVAEVRRVALIGSLVERIAFFAGVGREIDDGLRCRRSGVPAGGIVTLVFGGVVAVIAFERRAVVERRGGDPTRQGFQCQAGTFLHAAELFG